MPRKRAPVELQRLRGETRPSRVSPDAPTPPSTRAEVPDYLDGDALAVWHRLAPSLEARGVLTVWDVDTFAAYCTAVVHHGRAVRLVNEAAVIVGRSPSTSHKHPALQVVRDQAALIVSLGSRFGLSPSDRAGLRTGRDDDHDDGGVLD